MKTKSLLFLALAIFAAPLLSAQTATVLRLTGEKNVTAYDANGAEIEVAHGVTLPEGALLEVGANTKLFLRTFAGMITTIDSDSVVVIEEVTMTPEGKEKTRLELKSGDLVANLDPAKRGVSDYGVRTPKGVAAARGTNFAVGVSGENATMSVTGGEVTFFLPGGGAIDFSAGTFLAPGSTTPIPLAEALAPGSPNAAAATRGILATTNALAQLVGMDAAETGVSSAVVSAALDTVVTTVGEAGNDDVLAAAAGSAAAGNAAVAAAVVKTAAKTRPSAAAKVVATVVEESNVSEEDSAALTETLTNEANEGIQESNAENTGTPPASEITEEEVATEIDEETPEIEVPNDNVTVSPSS